MIINVNDKVRLKLTEHGKIAVAMCEYLKYYNPDADGWIELHLWEVMFVFGPFMFNGNPNLPFDTNIELKDRGGEMNDEPTIIKSLEEHLKECGHTTVGQDIAAAILVIRDLNARRISEGVPVALNKDAFK